MKSELNQFSNSFYGFDIYSAKTLEQLNNLYIQVESSSYSDDIKKKIIRKIKERIKSIRIPKDLKKNMKRQIKFS